MKFAKIGIFMLALLSLTVAVAAQPAIDAVSSQSVDEGQDLDVAVTLSSAGAGSTVFSICEGSGCTPTGASINLAGATDISVSKNSDTSADVEWSPDFDAAGTYTVTINATDSDGESDAVEFTITVADVDAKLEATNLFLGGETARRSNPNHDDRDDRESNATGTITLTNSGGKTLTGITAEVTPVGFSLSDIGGKIEFDGTSLAPGATLIVNVNFRIPEGLDAINADGTVAQPQVANIKFKANELGSASVDSIVTMQAENNLDLDEVDITINEEDTESVKDDEDIEDIRPGDDIEIEVTVENRFDDKEDVEIEDIDVVIESNDELDLDEDDEINSAKADDKESVTIKFDIDDDAEENDERVTLSVIGFDEFGARHGEIIEFTLEVQREDHEISIRNVDLVPSTISCSEQVELSVSIRNTGSKDEDETFIRVVAADLGYNRVSERLDLEEDDSASRTFTIPVPEGLSTGGHRITVETFYETSELSERDGVILTKTACALDQDDEEPDDEPTDSGNQDDVVVVVTPPTQTPDDEAPVVDEEPTDEAQESFFEGPGIIALLILAYVIVIGGGILVAVKLLRK